MGHTYQECQVCDASKRDTAPWKACMADTIIQTPIHRAPKNATDLFVGSLRFFCIAGWDRGGSEFSENERGSIEISGNENVKGFKISG